MKKIRRRRVKRVKVPIGWREWVTLPGLCDHSIKAKIDTGARSSALHAWNIRPFARDGDIWVRFDLHPKQRNNALSVSCEARAMDVRNIRDTSGRTETRYIIRTPVHLDGKTWNIEIGLTNRDQMGFRMLLGRTAVRRRFLVDPAMSFLFGKENG